MPASEEPLRPPLIGVFVGGHARRMGGVAKGLLDAPDGSGSIVARLVREAHGVAHEVVLVGRHDAYATLGLPFVDDVAEDAGPLGGLIALLERADGRPAIALACDMPLVDRALLVRLAVEAPEAVALAPRRDGHWEPLCARYGASVAPLARTRLAAGRRGLQRLLDAAGARELVLTDAERARLADWDRPEDLG